MYNPFHKLKLKIKNQKQKAKIYTRKMDNESGLKFQEKCYMNIDVQRYQKEREKDQQNLVFSNIAVGRQII